MITMKSRASITLQIASARMVRVGRSRQRLRSTFLQHGLHTLPFASYGGETELVSSSARDNDQVNPRWHEARPQSKTFAAEPFHTISLNRAPDLARDDQAEPRRTEWSSLRCDEQREMRRCHATAQSLGSNELDVLAKPAAFPGG
jgi:hypothetical protein